MSTTGKLVRLIAVLSIGGFAAYAAQAPVSARTSQGITHYSSSTNTSNCCRTNEYQYSRYNASQTYKRRHFRLGSKYIENGEYEKAVRIYKRILNKENNNALANYGMGIAMLNLEKRLQAQVFFEKSVQSNPKFYEAYTALSASYVLTGHVDAAQMVLSKLDKVVADCGVDCTLDQSVLEARLNIASMIVP